MKVMDGFLTGRLVSSIVFLVLFSLAGCQQPTSSPAPPSAPSPTPQDRPSIGDIRVAPETYEGRVVTIEGEYLGWKGGYGSPPVTRSDWLVQDATGWLYVTEKPAGLDPLHDVGYSIEVTGLVRLTKDGEPYLYAQEIETQVEKSSALLLLQIDLRRKQMANPIPERLEQMKAMGMRTKNLGIQRIFIHFTDEPNPQQIDELEAIGIIPYPGSWIPPAGAYPTGFMIADMPVDKLNELTDKDYVVRLDTAEQVLEPKTE